jgi:hypothetical protein
MNKEIDNKQESSVIDKNAITHPNDNAAKTPATNCNGARSMMPNEQS